MAQERPGIMVYFDDILPSLQCLSLEDAGRLFIAMLQYGRDRTEPDFKNSAGLAIAWSFIKVKIDRDSDNYDRSVLKSRYGVYKRECGRRKDTPLGFDEWCMLMDHPSSPMMPPSSPMMEAYPTATATSNGNQQLEPQPQLELELQQEREAPQALTRSHRFVPPTLEEVTAYVQERGSMVDPQGFIDFYAAKGWMVGQNKMKDWRAACRNAEKWERWKRPSTRNDVKTASDYEGGEDFFGR